MIDHNTIVKKAGPTGSAATEYSGVIDCRAPDGIGALNGKVRLKLEVPAIAGLDDTKTTTFTLQDSADNSSFTDRTDFYPAKVFTGAGGVGAGAADTYYEWRRELRRYIRVKAVTASSPGTITAYFYYLKVVDGDQPGL
jgi:hypothetical protein